MTDKSQNLALAILKDAKTKGTLDVTIEAELAELVGAEARPKLKNVLGASEGTPEKQREVTRRQKDCLIRNLVSRLNDGPEPFYKRPKNVGWREVEAALEAATPELIYGLLKMEETGGEPAIIDIENNAFVICDCSAEAPHMRRFLNYMEASAMAKDFGVDMMTEAEYRRLRELGEFDVRGAWVWLGDGGGKIGHGYAKGVAKEKIRITEYSKDFSNENSGWRGILRLPKV